MALAAVAVVSQTASSPAPGAEMNPSPSPSTSARQNHIAGGSEILDLNLYAPSQPILNSYPKRAFAGRMLLFSLS